MEIRQDVDAYELGGMLWSGGKETWDELVKSGISENDIMSHLEEVFPDGADLTDVNDYLWHDGDTVMDALGYTDWDELFVNPGRCELEIERIKSDPDMKDAYEEEDIVTAIKYLEALPAEVEKCKEANEISQELRDMVGFLNGDDSSWYERGDVYDQISDLAEFIEKVDG